MTVNMELAVSKSTLLNVNNMFDALDTDDSLSVHK